MKKFKWLCVLKGLIFILIGITFIGVKFYDIQHIVLYEETEYLITGLNYASFMKLFDDIFKTAYYNILFFILFFAVGVIEIIGGKKNGN